MVVRQAVSKWLQSASKGVIFRQSQSPFAIASVRNISSEEGEAVNPTNVFLKEAFQHLDLKPSLVKAILNPDRQMTVNLVVPMENGEVELFTAHRVQHNNSRGPFKGGLMIHQDVTLEAIRNLASLNTWKTALMNVPFGGSKGGIAVDPKLLTERELQKLTRKFLIAMHHILGPATDIPAPDINTDERHMAWMFDAYAKLNGFSPGVVTGKPTWLHGSYGRDTATGRGAVICTREFMRHVLKSRIQGSTFVLQGFGKLGGSAAQCLHEMGGKVIAVATSESAIYNENGLDIPALRKHAVKTGEYLASFPGGEAISNDESFLEIPCDVLIPAAVGGTIKGNAAQLNCKAVVEAGNSAITPEGDQILAKRGIPVLPDLCTNGGGMVVSYFEWVQNQENLQWEEEQVWRTLDNYMVSAFDAMYHMHKLNGVSLRTAAYMVAMERIALAEKNRGYG